MYVSTVAAFVRTSSGVVQVNPGDPAPGAALDAEIVRLVAAGVLVDAPEASGEDAAAETGPRAAASRSRSRGQSGTKKGA